MPRSFRGPFRGRSKPLHPTRWINRANGALNAGLTSGATQQVDLAGEDALEVFTNPTVVRIRGHLQLNIAHDQLITQEVCDIFLGIIVVEGDDVWIQSLAGQDGQENPWLWLYYTGLHSSITSDITFNSAGALTGTVERAETGPWSSDRIAVDVKAMRRVPQGHKIILVTTNVARVGTPDAVLRGGLRLLIKE